MEGHPSLPSTRDDGTRRGVMVTPRGRASIVDTALEGLPTAVSEMLTHGASPAG